MLALRLRCATLRVSGTVVAKTWARHLAPLHRFLTLFRSRTRLLATEAYVFDSQPKELLMARLTVSLPDELLTKLDRLAKREHRSRSELLREAARRYLSQPEEASTRPPKAASPRTARHTQKWTKEKLEQFLLDKGVIRRGCPELEALLGPAIGPVDMAKVLEIGKKLKGLSQQIIDAREDRV